MRSRLHAARISALALRHAAAKSVLQLGSVAAEPTMLHLLHSLLLQRPNSLHSPAASVV